MPRSDNSYEFQKIWHELRTDETLVPARSTVNPAHLKNFLTNLSIVEMDFEQRVMPVRLMGTAVCDFLGRDITGQDYAPYEKTPDENVAWENRESYHSQPRGLYAEVDFIFVGHRPFHACYTILPIWGH